ncbi:DoxX family protein [Candidatus Woesearchaeota archaeon]|nr:DoxX family protein [Candidatus Woesearchaeota archaeon]
MAKNSKFQGLSLTLLRVVLGFMFAYHGYSKLFVAGALPGTAKFFAAIGIPLANYAAVIVAFAEFFGGILLVLGLLTRLASLVLIIEMLVAFFKVHLKQGFLISQQAYGYEYVLLILAVLIALLLNGPGKLAVGKFVKNKWLQ